MVTVWKCGNLNSDSYWTIRDCMNPKRSLFDIYWLFATLDLHSARFGDAKDSSFKVFFGSSLTSYVELPKNPFRVCEGPVWAAV